MTTDPRLLAFSQALASMTAERDRWQTEARAQRLSREREIAEMDRLIKGVVRSTPGCVAKWQGWRQWQPRPLRSKPSYDQRSRNCG
jgi:hypothetical protein